MLSVAALCMSVLLCVCLYVLYIYTSSNFWRPYLKPSFSYAGEAPKYLLHAKFDKYQGHGIKVKEMAFNFLYVCWNLRELELETVDTVSKTQSDRPGDNLQSKAAVLWQAACMPTFPKPARCLGSCIVVTCIVNSACVNQAEIYVLDLTFPIYLTLSYNFYVPSGPLQCGGQL